MKKIFLSAIILGTLTMCKKADLQESNSTISTADSIAEKASEIIEKSDSDMTAVIDSVNLKTKDLIKNKEDIEKAFDKEKEKIDSISEDINQFKKDIEGKKISVSIDSITRQIKKEIPKQKTIKKVIYRNKTQNNQPPASETATLVKNGSVEITVENLAVARQNVKDIIRKYDAIVKTENLVTNDEFQTFYITSKVPYEKFDYLVEDLGILGTVNNKNLESKGETYRQNKLCNLDITLYENHLTKKESEKYQTFGEKSMDAISSGWHVIVSILLFLLPFWPLFLISGIGYYFYKKNKKQNNSENKTEQ